MAAVSIICTLAVVALIFGAVLLARHNLRRGAMDAAARDELRRAFALRPAPAPITRATPAREPARGPVCAKCRRSLPLEEPDAADLAFMRHMRMPTCYLGTVCQACGKIECYSCRGGPGLPCSTCGGSVSPAYAHMFGP
jgi:hypothetical protein